MLVFEFIQYLAFFYELWTTVRFQILASTVIFKMVRVALSHYKISSFDWLSGYSFVNYTEYVSEVVAAYKFT